MTPNNEHGRRDATQPTTCAALLSDPGICVDKPRRTPQEFGVFLDRTTTPRSRFARQTGIQPV